MQSNRYLHICPFFCRFLFLRPLRGGKTVFDAICTDFLKQKPHNGFVNNPSKDCIAVWRPGPLWSTATLRFAVSVSVCCAGINSCTRSAFPFVNMLIAVTSGFKCCLLSSLLCLCGLWVQ